jgi:hypothetical protein
MAVIGAIRPVGTAPNSPGFRTNQGSMPKVKFPKISTNFAQASASTSDATTRGIQRSAPFKRCAINPRPIKVKQKAVLGAIGIYLARTLASNGTPEIQPMSVSKPNAIASDAQISEIIRKLQLSLRSSGTPLVCRNTRICPRPAAFESPQDTLNWLVLHDILTDAASLGTARCAQSWMEKGKLV